MKNLVWFENTECSDLNITKYKSNTNDTVIAQITISDKDIIQQIISLIQKIPPQGDKMKSFGPDAKKISLAFTCTNKPSQIIEIYNDKIKTPSTGFLSTADAAETQLIDLTNALLNVSLETKLSKLINYAYKFKDFTITFTGTKHKPQPTGGPSLGPSNQNFYTLSENGHANTVNFNIYDGQIPAQPQAFVVGKNTYYLLTYKSPKGEDLYPNYFMISSKKPN